METNIYDADTLPIRTMYRSVKPIIRFSVSNTITFNRYCCEILNLTPERKVVFEQDQKNKEDWYIYAGPNGFKVRKIKISVGFSHAKLCDIIRESLNIPQNKPFGLKICEEPIQEGMNMLHALLKISK